MAREPAEELASAAPGVAFELERFEWVADDRIELVGRWSGLRGHRFLRPTLDVVVDGERRRMLAVLEHKPWAAESGEEWVAAFTWHGDRTIFDEAELTVSPDLAVELPAAGGSRTASKKKAAGAVDSRPARRPRTAVLEEELASVVAEAQELREQLRTEQTNVRGLETQLRLAREEMSAAQEERDAARGQADEARTAADAAHEEAATARKRTESAQAEADAARKEAQAAMPEAGRLRVQLEEAQRDRDAALERLKETERERAAATEARDRARDERNAWMQRARAVAAGRPSAPAPVHEAPAPPEPDPAPEPQPEPSEAPTEQVGERRTIQIGERPGPLRPPETPLQPDAPAWRGALDKWGPRVLALVLAVLAIVVVVLVLLSVL
jgi:hypothetical protein